MIERLDLNLLLAFDALMRERSVSRAAARLGLGQPATSAALGRLRRLYGDTLFVRTPAGMEPTRRASDIAAPIAAALAQLRATLDPGTPFDPARATRTFSINSVDYLALVALPRLVSRLQRDAPGVNLHLRSVEKDLALDYLDDGRIQLAVAVVSDVRKHLAVEPLLTERFVCVTRGNHPLAESGLTAETYARLPHILVTQRGDASGAVDDVLREMGLSRRIAVTVPQFAVVPLLLADTDLVATLGRRAAMKLATSTPLRLYEPPIPLPRWRLDLIWSRRNDGDPGLAWLRAELRTAVAAFDEALPRLKAA